MAWVTPRTYTVGELLTKSILDQHIRDNLLALKNPPAAIDFSSGISTSSGTLVDITGSSIVYTATGTGGADVFWVGNFSTGGGATVTFSLNDNGTTVFSIALVTAVASQLLNCSFPYHIASQALGSHTLKMQVATNSGTVTVTGYQLYVVERGS